MAPLDPDATAQSNAKPIAVFSAQILLVIAASTKVLLTAQRGARALPPPTSTRAQRPVRRRHVILFSALAFLSLSSVTFFAVIWRVLSYLEWAETGNHQTPGSLWTGWYGTGEKGVGRWRLGDWMSDKDLVRESDAMAVSKFEVTSQHFVGLLANSLFIGIEGRKRSLGAGTIVSLVFLSAGGSLSYALCLLFIIILYTPLTLHDDTTPNQDALFMPKPAVYYVPVVLSLLGLNSLPTLLAKNADITLLRYGYLAMPLFLAFAPQIIPHRWGHHHTSKAAAHRSVAKAFYVLSVVSFILHWKILAETFFANIPPERSSVYDLTRNAILKEDPMQSNRLFVALSNTAQRLKRISTHPAISVTTLDILFTTISLLAWTFTRELDIEAMLENSVLSFLSPSKAEKHVAFDRQAEVKTEPAVQAETPVPAVTPRKRGRPRKTTLTNGDSTHSVPSSTSTLRRSTRRTPRSDFEPEAEDAYEPPASAKKEVLQMEADGAPATEDYVRGGEATALALCLAFAGGLGQLVAGVLGAEVTSTGE